HFLDGKRGLPQLDLSRVAIIPKRKKPFVAACLVSRYKYGFKNEILFVRPQFQNRGIGTALVSNVINDLREIGETFLWSEYQICNEQSAKWHEKFGFVEEPDILVTRLRYHFLKCEIWRNEKLGCVAKTQKLKISLEKVEAELDVLAKLESSDFNAARSFWRYDF
ncbi:MAG: GNAT family N-acetyltransferase, partial [Pyrinomonadaceae bacterium]|nr:GNAT family N-acetyltransferase [Pyrinomonadaceae bacterium]